MYVAGLAVAGFAWPRGSVGGYGDVSASGSWFWALVGCAVLTGGAGLALVGLVGWGVKLGREATTYPASYTPQQRNR